MITKTLSSDDLEEIEFSLSSLKGCVTILESMAEDPSIKEKDALNNALRLLGLNINNELKSLSNFLESKEEEK